MFVYNFFSLSNAVVKPTKPSSKQQYKIELQDNEWLYLNTDLLQSNDNITLTQQTVGYIVLVCITINTIIKAIIESSQLSNTNMTNYLVQHITRNINNVTNYLPNYINNVLQSIYSSILYASNQIISPTQILFHSLVVCVLSAAVFYVIYTVINYLVNQVKVMIFGLPVYLIDFTTFNAPDHWKVSFERFRQIATNFKFSSM